MKKKTPKKQEGFTLIEATVVMFIIGLLMLLVLPNLSKQKDRAQETHAKAMVATVQTQVDLYLNDHPNQKGVTIDELAEQDYLTKQQVEKVKSLNIQVVGHEAKV